MRLEITSDNGSVLAVLEMFEETPLHKLAVKQLILAWTAAYDPPVPMKEGETDIVLLRIKRS